MDLPYNFVDSIAKMVPQELNITLEKALKMNPELRKSYENDPQVQDVYKRQVFYLFAHNPSPLT